ncbi:hypothetical protein [Faecalibacterium prausnitzii]|uniref:Uncharacterized protein n=1 Tax=Faecalibacterium prausnitzii TaxID=853 RepID=A0A564T1F7_9FIRM|nr:Uncharacterised protein [Faecalibacterium prausnitzii]
MAKPKNLEQLRAEKEQVETQLAQEQHYCDLHWSKAGVGKLTGQYGKSASLKADVPLG